jgi:hypothetical protein
VNLTIYNLLGQKVVCLLDKKLDSGQYHSVWDGQNFMGQLSASGLYFFTLTVENQRQSVKVLYQK